MTQKPNDTSENFDDAMDEKVKSILKKIGSHLTSLDLDRFAHCKRSSKDGSNNKKRTEAAGVPSNAAPGFVSTTRSYRKPTSTATVAAATSTLKSVARATAPAAPVARAAGNETLLVNGLLAAHRLTTTNGRLMTLINTCAFDSLAAILARAYLDVPAYRLYVNGSDNAMLRFCRDLAISGPRRGPAASVDRARVMWPALDLQPLRQPGAPGQIAVVDAKCNVAHVVTRLLADAPSSVERVGPCSRCLAASQPPRDWPSASVVLQWPARGPEWLQAAVEEYADQRLAKCSTCSRLSEPRRRDLSAHLLIEADACAELYGNTVRASRLPVQLFRDGKRYMLYGVVHYSHNHYTSVIGRPKNWEIHDDLKSHIQTPTKVEYINPHLVVYIRT